MTPVTENIIMFGILCIPFAVTFAPSIYKKTREVFARAFNQEIGHRIASGARMIPNGHYVAYGIPVRVLHVGADMVNNQPIFTSIATQDNEFFTIKWVSLDTSTETVHSPRFADIPAREITIGQAVHLFIATGKKKIH